MSDYYANPDASIRRLREVIKSGQHNFMWRVRFAYIPFYFQDNNIGFVCQQTNIPEIQKKYKVRRFLNTEHTMPAGKTITHEITLTIINESDFSTYDVLRNWSDIVDYNNYGVGTIASRTNASVQFLSLDGTIVNRSFTFVGIYPINVPPIDGLDKNGMDGLISYPARFAFDRIDYFGVTETNK
jgi:hypothetical protein